MTMLVLCKALIKLTEFLQYTIFNCFGLQYSIYNIQSICKISMFEISGFEAVVTTSKLKAKAAIGRDVLIADVPYMHLQ